MLGPFDAGAVARWKGAFKRSINEPREEKPVDRFSRQGVLLCYKTKLMRIVDI